MKFILSWLWNIKLHNKILLGLLLGALFGALLNVSKYELILQYKVDGKEKAEKIEKKEKSWANCCM